MPDAKVEEAYEFLRANTAGDLRFDEHFRPVKFVIEPGGQLIAPVMVAMLAAHDPVMFIPEATDGAMELQVTLVRFDEHTGVRTGYPDDEPIPGGALADRWRIHHGDPPDVNWALLDIDAAQYQGVVIDGQPLTRANPLATDEAKLCREMNTERAADLRSLCRHFGHVNVEEPVMVAIDPLGLDVRGRFDVIRVAAPTPMNDADEARDRIAQMIETAGEPTPS